MQGSLSGAVLGANGLSKTIIGFLAASAGSKFAVDQPVTRLLALFLFTIGDGILVTILGAMVGPALGATYSVALTSWALDRKSTRLNSSHVRISYAVFCLKKKKDTTMQDRCL